MIPLFFSANLRILEAPFGIDCCACTFMLSVMLDDSINVQKILKGRLSFPLNQENSISFNF